MKTAATLLVLCSLASAGTAGPKATPEQIKQALLQIEHDVVRGNETCDRAVFERIEADEFIFTNTVGKVTDKQQDLASLKDCHPSHLDASIDDARLQVHGKVAILNAHLAEHPTNKEGQVVTRNYRFTDVFVWRDGRWQMVLGQSARIPDPKPETPAPK